jgi:hypothetical protein
MAECEAVLVNAIRRCNAADVRAVIGQFEHLLEGSIFDRECERDIREQASKGLRFMFAAA